MPRKLLVKDLLTSQVVTLKPGDTLADAEQKMYSAKVRHLPVTDGEGRLAGILTHRMLLASWVSHGDPARERHEDVARDVFVEMLMEKNVITVSPETPAAEAARLLEEKRIGCLPVVGPDQRLVGIVTESDFVRFARIYLDHIEPEA